MKIKKVEDAINDTDNRRVKLEFEKEELEREINKLSDEALELISEREELLKNKIWKNQILSWRDSENFHCLVFIFPKSFSIFLS